MHYLNANWIPTYGTTYTWIAMDKNGLIAIMVNNNWGNLPKSILITPDIESILDDLNEYIWEESDKYHVYPVNKMGTTQVDLYSKVFFDFLRNDRQQVEDWIYQRSGFNQKIRDESVPSIKGCFLYNAVDGYSDGEDYPVGYEGQTKMGDYFRYLIPTVYASISDFPKELWHGIGVFQASCHHQAQLSSL